MSTKLKIKIQDDAGLRAEIDRLYENSDPILLARWSLSVARHVFAIAGIDYRVIKEVTDGFRVNELWQTGQAVASGHMKEHAMVASDNAVKTIEFLYHGGSGATGRDISAKGLSTKESSAGEAVMRAAITAERQWQLDELKKLK